MVVALAKRNSLSLKSTWQSCKRYIVKYRAPVAPVYPFVQTVELANGSKIEVLSVTSFKPTVALQQDSTNAVNWCPENHSALSNSSNTTAFREKYGSLMEKSSDMTAGDFAWTGEGSDTRGKVHHQTEEQRIEKARAKKRR